MAQNVKKVRKGKEVARWSETLEKWVLDMYDSINKAKKANGLGARCWKPGEAWPPAKP